eukprot:2345706-Pyramimonas_sp.AAC.1
MAGGTCAARGGQGRIERRRRRKNKKTCREIWGDIMAPTMMSNPPAQRSDAVIFSIRGSRTSRPIPVYRLSS